MWWVRSAKRAQTRARGGTEEEERREEGIFPDEIQRNLISEKLFSAVNGLQPGYYYSVLITRLRGKGDGRAQGDGGVMGQKFGTAQLPLPSYLCCTVISVMGAIAREIKPWRISILWGLNIAHSLAAMTYQVASTKSQHPTRHGVVLWACWLSVCCAFFR